jgi:hypothetical protein
MATITFASVTLWNDSTSGYGSPALRVDAPSRVYAYEGLPRGTGLVAKHVGINPGSVALVCNYRIADGSFGGLLTTLDGMRNLFGSLSIRGASYTNLVFDGYNVDQNRPIVEGGSVVRLVAISFRFVKVRP